MAEEYIQYSTSINNISMAEAYSTQHPLIKHASKSQTCHKRLKLFRVGYFREYKSC